MRTAFRPTCRGPVISLQPSLIYPPIGFAHRGARAHEQENTIKAFALALRLGAPGLESDVWLSKDGQVILDHDGYANKLRRRPIGSVDRDQLPEHMPTLPELFDAVGTDYHLSLDIKDDEAAAEVIRVTTELAPDLVPRLWLCHPDFETVASWRELSSDVKLVDSTRIRKMKNGPERRAKALQELGIDAVNMHHSDWTGGLVALFHRFERVCFGWDAQHERVIGGLTNIGIDGVFSDHVDRLTSVIPN